MSETASHLGGGGVTLLVLALLCWLLMVMNLTGVVGQDFHGDAVVGAGFQWLAAAVFAALTWLWLGGLTLKAGTQGRMPAWANVVAIVLMVLSAGAALAAFYLMQDPKTVWPVVIPAVIPPVLVFYVFALYSARLRPMASGTSASAAVWGFIALLSLLPLPSLMVKVRAETVGRAKAMAQWKAAERERARAENLPKLQAMTPDKPLNEYFPFLNDESGVQADALAAMRKLDRRQADIIDMLGWGIPKALDLLPELDLQPTPQLCAAANASMIKSAHESRVRPKQEPRTYTAGGDFDYSVPAIRWLKAHGCDCDPSIAAFEASVSSHLDSPDRRAALETIAQLRAKP